MHPQNMHLVHVVVDWFYRYLSLRGHRTIIQQYQWGNPEEYGMNLQRIFLMTTAKHAKQKSIHFSWDILHWNGNVFIFTNYLHWLYQKLSLWQLLVQPVKKISSKWHYHISSWKKVEFIPPVYPHHVASWAVVSGLVCCSVSEAINIVILYPG